MILDQLEPRSVFHYFEALCAIPHGSGNTKAVSDYCVRFAETRGLEHYQDALNNVVIIAPAAAGYEDAPPVIVQGHLDMVCAAAPGCEKDMAREGLELFVDGDLIGARGTSLGGDDGAAVAMILALLDDPRPRLEAVFTTDEETGMFGAQGLDVSPLKGRTLLNLDSEAEGVFTVACAGGARVYLRWTPRFEPVAALPMRVTIGGLRGGHSGVEIDKGRGNANILMGRLLREVCAGVPIRLLSLRGGTADNAIPLSCEAEIAVAPEDAEAAYAAVDAVCGALRAELALTDPGLRIGVAPGQPETVSALTQADTAHILDALSLVPNGIQSMSFALPGLPETSLNLGVLSLDPSGAVMTFSVRSSVASRKKDLIEKLRCVAAVTGAEAEISGDYPAWEYNSESEILPVLCRLYEEQCGEKPVIKGIHAGLECGVIYHALKPVDIVSFGPTIKGAHTPTETLSVESTQRTFRLLLDLLGELK